MGIKTQAGIARLAGDSLARVYSEGRGKPAPEGGRKPLLVDTRMLSISEALVLRQVEASGKYALYVPDAEHGEKRWYRRIPEISGVKCTVEAGGRRWPRQDNQWSNREGRRVREPVHTKGITCSLQIKEGTVGTKSVIEERVAFVISEASDITHRNDLFDMDALVCREEAEKLGEECIGRMITEEIWDPTWDDMGSRERFEEQAREVGGHWCGKRELEKALAVEVETAIRPVLDEIRGLEGRVVHITCRDGDVERVEVGAE